MSRVSLQDSINPKPLSEGIGEEYPRHPLNQKKVWKVNCTHEPYVQMWLR
jgi:hypothetical protein